MVGINDDGQFSVHFTNFGYTSSLRGRTLDEAREIARKARFQSAIYEKDVLVGTWCPSVGFKRP